VPVVRRQLASEELTWADLLRFKLSRVAVYALYFPSRFDLPVDVAARGALEVFGKQTGGSTSVNFWDATDPEFSRALKFFDLEAPPAVVLATGLKPKAERPPDRADVYAIAISDPAVLGDREQLARAVNSAHEVLVRGDPKEITGYLRQRAAGSLLTAIARIAGRLRDEVLRFKPKFQLPGGVSIQVG
jgi:hypothetical protein